MLARSHVGWGLALSLLLHVTGIGALTLALPRLNVRAGAVQRAELTSVQEPPPKAASTRPAPPLTAAAPVEMGVEPATDALALPVAAGAGLAPAAAGEIPLPAPAASDPHAAHAASDPQRASKPLQQPKLARNPKRTPATPEPKLQSPAHADPSSDGSALERVLRQIAATTELTQDERRRAMLVVLRTWEDPSGKHSADELIEALLKSVRQARTTTPADRPADPASPQP